MQEVVNPVLYGGAALQTRELPKLQVPEEPAQDSRNGTLASVLQGTQAYQQGAAAQAQAALPLPTVGESAAAATSQWFTTGLYRFFTDPTFPPDGSNASEQIMTSGMDLNNDEMKYVEKFKSADGRDFAMQRVQTAKKADTTAAAHPWVSLAVASGDPFTLGIAAVTGGLSSAAGVSSFAAKAAASGAQMGALVAATAQTRPMSTAEGLTAILAEMGAAKFVGAKGTKKVLQGDGKLVEVPEMVPHDPDFPAADLQAIATGKPVVKEVPEFGAMASGEMGDIMLTPSAKAPGKYQLTYFSDNIPVEDHLFDTMEEAQDAFMDAVDMDGATVLQKSWNESTPDWAKQINPDTIEGKVMAEDAGLTGKSMYPEDLQPGIPHEPAKVAAAVQKVLERENKTWIQKVGSRLEWNIHKSMREFGDVGNRIADILFDNNGNIKITSVESHIRGVSAQLKTVMGKFDNLLNDAMAERGYGTWKQIWDNAGAAKVQEQLEREVSLEMLRRDQLLRQGRAITHDGVPKHITDMADALDRVAKKALDEMQAAGVNGVEELTHTSGWASRRWSSVKVQQAIDRIAAKGHDVAKAKKMLVEVVARSVADANPGLEWELAHDIAKSTIDRSLRKGALEDAAFITGQGMDNAKGIRDMLHAEGISAERIQRIMDRVVGKVDETGKASFLKHRINMDYTSSLDLGGDVINVTDLFDHGIKDIFDRYIDKAAAEAGFARKGLRNTSDIAKLREEGIAALKGDTAKIKEFAELFDNSVAHMFGESSGGDMGKAMRNMAAFNRLISLGASGYWQLTEYAKMMQQYGALKTIKYMVQELPMFKDTLATVAKDKQLSTHLKDILEFASTDNLRLRPFVRRFADGFEMPANATLSGKLQHATQLVPYLNGMKWVHGHQARVMANLTLDCINRAATGDAKMVAALEKYGVTAEHFKSLKADVLAHGMDVGKWGDANWANVRPAFMKMMDEGVLHARLGDTPAFALLHPVGKFLCTYRGFTLTAHNKLLAGTIQRDGLAGLGLMMVYQYPLSALAVQAQATINNKKPLTMKELAALSMTQMGSMGLISEVAGVVSGSKKQVGSPGLIPLDRAYAAVGELGKLAKGDGSAARLAHDLFQLMPGLAVLAPARSFEGFVNPQGAASTKESK